MNTIILKMQQIYRKSMHHRETLTIQRLSKIAKYKTKPEAKHILKNKYI